MIPGEILRARPALGDDDAAAGLGMALSIFTREVEADSPAEHAGIAQGDLVVAVAGQPTPDVDDLHVALGTAKFPFEVSLVRGTEERMVTIEEAAASEGSSRRASGNHPQPHHDRLRIPPVGDPLFRVACRTVVST